MSYYGQTIQDPDLRFWHQQHFLRRNSHHNPRFQADWAKYGESAFTYEIIDTPPIPSWAALTLLRNAYARNDPNCYNMRLWNVFSKQPGKKTRMSDAERKEKKRIWRSNWYARNKKKKTLDK